MGVFNSRIKSQTNLIGLVSAFYNPSNYASHSGVADHHLGRMSISNLLFFIDNFTFPYSSNGCSLHTKRQVLIIVVYILYITLKSIQISLILSRKYVRACL